MDDDNDLAAIGEAARVATWRTPVYGTLGMTAAEAAPWLHKNRVAKGQALIVNLAAAGYIIVPAAVGGERTNL